MPKGVADTRRRIAIGKIETADHEAVRLGFDIAAVVVVGIAGQAKADEFRTFAARENGNAIPAFLAMPDRVVAALADCSDRKPVIGRLEFLQAHNIGLFVGKPAKQVGQAAVNTVDIVGGDFQSSKSVGDDETSTARQRIGHGRAFHILTVKSVAGP